MPFLDTSRLKVVERLPGWKGRFFHTATMTFADYEFMAGSTIHEHFHPEEEMYEVIAGSSKLLWTPSRRSCDLASWRSRRATRATPFAR